MSKASFLATFVAAALVTGCVHAGSTPALPPLALPGESGARPTAGGYRIVASFGSNPAFPAASVVSVNGTLYGTTYTGGAFNGGSLYSVAKNGTIATLHDFGGKRDGKVPLAEVLPVNGVLYGTTSQGGTGGGFGGTVYSYDLATKKYSILHNFGYGKDGQNPRSGLISFNGKLYGATQDGGKFGVGTVYSIEAGGAERVVCSFQGGSDGRFPTSDLLASNGVFYGTTGNGGPADYGTVYAVNAAGDEHVVYAFTTGTDAAFPAGGLTPNGAQFVGATSGGGAYSNSGALYSVTRNGAESVLHSFGKGKDGASPFAGLTYVKGSFYGTTAGGGRYGKGTLFTLRGTTETILHDFGSGNDAAHPDTKLTLVNGTLYGTSDQGGSGGNGTVFAYTP